MTKRHCKMSRGAMILIFGGAIFLSLPSMRGLVEDTKKRELIENRSLTPFPSLDVQALLTGTFFSQLDLYLSDHFGYSEKLHRFHQSIVYFIFRDDPVPNLTVGRDGFVFLNSHSRDTPYAALESLCIQDGSKGDQPSLEQHWPSILESISSRGMRAVVAVVPSKPVLYPEMLPRRVPEALRKACRDYGGSNNRMVQLRRQGAKRGLAIYYPFEEFAATRYTGNFYPKENFHWAGESIHLFMVGLFDTLGITPTTAYLAEPQVTDTRAELSRVLGVRLTATIRDYDYPEFGVMERPREPAYISQWYSRASDFREASTDNPLTSRTALLISNSFGAFAVKHLAPAYRKVVQVNVNDVLPEEGAGFFEAVIRRVAPDDIIFLFHDEAAIAEGKRIYRYLLGDRAPIRGLTPWKQP